MSWKWTVVTFVVCAAIFIGCKTMSAEGKVELKELLTQEAQIASDIVLLSAELAGILDGKKLEDIVDIVKAAQAKDVHKKIMDMTADQTKIKNEIVDLKVREGMTWAGMIGSAGGTIGRTVLHVLAAKFPILSLFSGILGGSARKQDLPHPTQ